ncbi:MAG: hypothetical protein ACRDTT_03215 [Pseudonocardiaceae bacterium]
MEVEAVQWDGTVGAATEIIGWVHRRGGAARYAADVGDVPIHLAINSGLTKIYPDDWVVYSNSGRFVRISPGEFDATYRGTGT